MKLFTTLPDLLPASTTIPIIESVDEPTLDYLLELLPPTLLLLAQEADDDASSVDPSPATIEAAIQSLSRDQKREILAQVLRSPQLSQSLGSLNVGLREGGLPVISEVLGVQVRNGGYMTGSGVPLGGGEAVKVFVEGIKSAVEEEDEEQNTGDESRMDTEG